MKPYNLLTSLAQSNAGVNIAQLLRSVAKEAEGKARELFRGSTGRKVRAAFKKKAIPHAVIFDDLKRL